MKYYFNLLIQSDGAVDVTTMDAPATTAQNNLTIDQKAPGANSEPKGEAAKPQQGSGWTMWIMLGLIFVVMWFFMIRPQRKQQKELQKFRDALKKGDKVVTIGGIYGTVVELKEHTVLIEVDNGVKIRVSKQALIKDFSESQQ